MEMPNVAIVTFHAKWAEDAPHLALVLRGKSQVHLIAGGVAVSKIKALHYLGWSSTYLSNTEVSKLSEQDREALVCQIVDKVKECRLVFCDIGPITHLLVRELQGRVVIYYCNPNPYVGGGYSGWFERTMAQESKPKAVLVGTQALKDGVLFGENQQPINFGATPRYATQFFNLDKVLEIQGLDQETCVQELFAKHGLEDEGQQIVYFIGGANEKYYEMFEQFVVMVEEYRKERNPSILLFFRKHPSSELVRQQMPDWWIETNEDISTVAKASNLVIFQQSSLEHTFALAAVPFISFEHEEVSIDSFAKKLNAREEPPEVDLKKALESDGYRLDWEEHFQEVIKELLDT